MEQKPIIKTSCRDCLFAQWDGRTQTGCEFDKINKYKNIGVVVEQIVENDMKCYTINALCTTSRAITWPKVSLKHDILKLKELAREEAKIYTDCIIICNEFNKEKLDVTIKDALNQTFKFKNIIVATKDKPTDYIIYCIENIGYKNNWELVSINLDNKPENQDEESFIFDEAIYKVKSTYYTIYKAGDRINNRISEAIDYAIGDVLHRFLVATPGKSNGLIIQKKVSEAVNNFKESDPVTKIMEWIKTEIDNGELKETQINQFITTHQTILDYLGNTNECNSNNCHA